MSKKQVTYKVKADFFKAAQRECFKKGDEVTVENLPGGESQVKALIKNGTIEEVKSTPPKGSSDNDKE